MLEFIKISFLSVILSSITIYVIISFLHMKSSEDDLTQIMDKGLHSMWFIMLIAIITVLGKTFYYIVSQGVALQGQVLLSILITFCLFFFLMLILIWRLYKPLQGHRQDKVVIFFSLLMPMLFLLTGKRYFYDLMLLIYTIAVGAFLLRSRAYSRHNYSVGGIMLFATSLTLVVSDIMSYVLDQPLFDTISLAFMTLAMHSLFFIIVSYFVNRLKDSYEKVEHQDSLLEDSHYELQKMVYYDQVTGLPNKNALDLALQDAKTRTVYCMVNIQNFLGINNLLGYERGDWLLKQVAHSLHKLLLTDEVAYRYYADKFIICFNDTPTSHVYERVETLKTYFEHHPFSDVNLTLYYGLYEMSSPSSDITGALESVIASLEIASAKAKEMDEKIYYFSDHDRTDFNQDFNFELNLKNAIVNKHFKVYYQAQVDAKTHHLYGFEALARWEHEGEMIPPDKFITRAEELGWMYPLTRQIIEMVFEDISQNALFNHRKVAINLSGAHLIEDAFMSFLQEMINYYHIDPTQIVFEITESILFNDLKRVMVTIRQLKSLGFQVSLDDFGNGYSSFYRFATLPIDEVKFDKSFLKDVLKDQKMKDTLRLISKLFKSYDMRIVLEGIETCEQLETINDMSIDILQGYLFSKPVSLETMKTLTFKS